MKYCAKALIFFVWGGGYKMLHVSSRAVDKLKDELVQKCLDAGIGFRIMITTDETGKITSTMKFDRQRQEDAVIDLGGVKLFSDPSNVSHIKDYHLDYMDNPEGGFFLIKKALEARVAR
jgi:Fe-S cluster assembly iron-binding protein IscA